jgi:neurotransmitter:Na+ symporter, NSS family
MEEKVQKRENWSNQFNFILSGIGAAIGIGNLWLFPWRLTTYGGGAFLIPYLIFVFCFVRLGLTAEFAFGRSQQQGPLGAFRAVFHKKFNKTATILGVLPGISLFAILCFYIIVTGWIATYTALFLVDNNIISIATSSYFQSFAGSSQTLVGLIVVTCVVALTILFGVKKGIEKCNTIAMPLFFAILLILLIRSLTLNGAPQALCYMFTFTWEQLLNINTWIMALGQSFFTVSLGGMLTYGSYLSKNSDIPEASFWTVFFNTSASIIATLVILPAIFSFNLDIKSGPALMFITIPQICTKLPYGIIFGSLFFFCALLAALTSAINLMEVATETISSFLKTSRTISTFIIISLMLTISMPLSINMNHFNSWTDFVTVYFYPFIPLIIQVVYFWIYGTQKAVIDINAGSKHPISILDTYVLKYIFPIICFVVIVLGIIYHGIG